jgi:tetratricopeptide (TPR) repeat protein
MGKATAKKQGAGKAAKTPKAGKAPATGQARSGRSSSGGKAPAPAPAPVVRRRPTPEEVAHQHSLERFESGLQFFNRNQFAKARGMFERLLEDPARELAERAKVYLRICDQRLAHASPQLKTADDLYNHAVGLANQGNPEEAEQHLRKALKLSPQADYLYYALATTFALRENVEGALEYLLKAIELNERNRYQAQNDPDFANLLEDPRFTELLYPEKPIS